MVTQQNANNIKNNHLEEGDGVFQYNWLWQPNCTEPGLW